jgi:cell division septum initiation protein DivIVA
MFRRAGSDRTDAARLDDLLEPAPAAEPGGADRDPDGARPAFRVRLHGYDRLQVDNYVARTEWELRSTRRHADHLLDRFGSCSAELEICRRSSARTSREQQVGSASESIAEILRLAADEATQMVDTAGEEADRLLAEARLEAEARLGKAHAIKEMAVSAGEELHEQARRDRTEAAALLDRARGDAEELLRDAREERNRLEAEATAAQDRTQAALARLAAVQEELVDLQRQRDEARSSLRRLTDQIGQVLQAVDPGDLVGPRREPGVLTTAP